MVEAQFLRPRQPDAPVAEEPAGPTVAQRLQDVKQRLQAAKQIRDAEGSSYRKREIELLTRLESSFTKLTAVQEQLQQLQADQTELETELVTLRKHGIDNPQSTTFLRLDQSRDELNAERRRLSRLVAREADAAKALEKANQRAKDRSSARRQAAKNLDTNDDNTRLQSLGELLAEATLQEEVAKAVTELREQELAGARQAIALQQVRLTLLEETVARLGTATRFESEELSEILLRITAKEDQISLDIAAAERAKTKYPDLPRRLASLQAALDTTADGYHGVSELIDGLELKVRIHQSSVSLLQSQLVRLADQRTAWERRHQLFVAKPDLETLREWTEQTQQLLIDLGREARATENDITDYRVELDKFQERFGQQKLSRSPELARIKQQIAALGEPLQVHQQSLAIVRDSQQLHSRLLKELESDSLAATAREKLHDLWASVVGVWNAELTEVGDTTFTIAKVVKAMLVLLAGLVFARSLSRALGRQVLRRLDIDASATATIQSLFYYTLLIISGLVALKAVSVPLTAFTFLGGAIALGVGFGSQNVINNFLSGLILLAERPVKVGDLVQVDDLYGNIEHIGARSTVVRTGSNLEIIVPNSSFLQNNVVNFTRSSDKVRTFVPVGVAYGTSPVSVKQMLRQAVVETHRIAKEPPPIILFKDFGDNSLLFEVHFWIRMRTMMDRFQIESAVRYRIVQLFEEKGLVVAFPQRDIHLDTLAPLEIQMVPPQPAALGDSPPDED